MGMGIKDFVYGSRLQNQARFGGRVSLKATDQDGLVDRMLEMGTSLTKTVILAVLTLLVTAVGNVSREGFKINIEDFLLFTLSWVGCSVQTVETKGFHQIGDHERVFLLPLVTFTSGIFELTATLGTKTPSPRSKQDREPGGPVMEPVVYGAPRRAEPYAFFDQGNNRTEPLLRVRLTSGSPLRLADRWAGPPCLTVSVATTDCLGHIH